MSLAADHGIEVQVGDMARSDLYTADEIFVVGTAAEVSAVNSVDDRPVPCPGPATKVLAEAYADLVRGKNDKYRHWNELAR
jgi:branched-chain amino acid aminotransferase